MICDRISVGNCSMTYWMLSERKFICLIYLVWNTEMCIYISEVVIFYILHEKVTEWGWLWGSIQKITVSQAEPNTGNDLNLLFDNLRGGDLILLGPEYAHSDYGMIQNVIRLICQYNTNHQRERTHHQKWRLITFL